MKDLFVPYEISTQLKNKRYNSPCFATYNDKTKELYLKIPDGLIGSTISPAFLYQQVVDWLRDEHHLHIEITCYSDNKNYNLHWYYAIVNLLNFDKGDSIIFKTYKEALNSAIIESLKLI